MDTEGTDKVGETTGRNATTRDETTRRYETRRHETRELFDQDLIAGYQEDTFRDCKGDRDLTYFGGNRRYLTGIIGKYKYYY